MSPRPTRFLVTLAAAGVVASAAARPRPASDAGAHALVGGRVILAPGRELPRATVLIRDGLIVAVGAEVAVPVDARTWDVQGMTVWPGLIDAHLALDRLNGKAKDEPGRQDAAAPAPAPAPRSSIGHENAVVRAETLASDLLAPDAATLDSLRKQGFTTAFVAPGRGVLRGRGVVVNLGQGPPASLVVSQPLDQVASFERGGNGEDAYPDSVMGATAVLRQALLDARWLRDATSHAARRPDVPRPEADASLQALLPLLAGQGRLAVACRDVLDGLRAGQVASELGLGLRLVGAGDEYRRLPELRALRAPVLVPVATPRPPAALTEDEWLEVSLQTLRHVDLAADNARFLHEAGVDVSLTTNGLEDIGQFAAQVRRMIRRGLDPAIALAMLTTRPAALLGLSADLGTLEKGKVANVVVSRGRPFEENTEVRDAWVDGRRLVVSRDPEGPLGPWQAELRKGDVTVTGRLTIERDGGGFRWTPPGGDAAKPERAKVTAVSVTGDEVTFEVEARPLGAFQTVKLTARVEGGRLSGGTPDGSVTLQGVRAWGPERAAGEQEPRRELPRRPGPLAAQDDALLIGATVWTCGPQGILEVGDVLVQDGRIAAVGPGLRPPPGVPVVDLHGKHLSPGLVDAHNHSAIVGGVNEGTNSCTAEVRIGDVVNSETVDIYRQLAGGLTTANLLHGSANCMGGQSQVIKLRWGASPEGLKFRAADEAIKFALGENVKQSNWGEKFTTRFPQTRMGVEQFMRQKFLEARSYREAHEAWKTGRGGAVLPPRRDLQLETLVEILEGKRTIHCHSYRQDEILMLMRVAEEMGFRVGTFQHVLEGYKVADEMARHGVAGSSFTDWWAYKFEVYDAIPYNPALMHERGVLVSVNSDSTELARRMNLEAAKVVKWGGVAPTEALRMVTLNPARQLGVDDRVGSIEVGKDADLVAWSGSPLSTSSRALTTWIEGLPYFDRERDLASRAAVEEERRTLVERAKKAREHDAGGGGDWRPSYLEEGRNHCMDNAGAASEVHR